MPRQILGDRIDVHVRRIEEIAQPFLPGASLPEFTHHDRPLARDTLDEFLRPPRDANVAVA